MGIFQRKDDLLIWTFNYCQYFIRINTKYNGHALPDGLIIASYILFLARYFRICDDRQIAPMRKLLSETIVNSKNDAKELCEKTQSTIIQTLSERERRAFNKVFVIGLPSLLFSENDEISRSYAKYSFRVFERNGHLRSIFNMSAGADKILLPITVVGLHEYIIEKLTNKDNVKALDKTISDLLTAYDRISCRSFEGSNQLPVQIINQNNINYRERHNTNLVVGTNGYALVEFEDIEKYVQGANNLMAVGKYKEAEVLLRPLFVTEWLNNSGEWHFGHDGILNYTYCLQNIDGRLDEVLNIFHALNILDSKPAEFYINYSLALLKAQKAEEARAICEMGLRDFQDDLDLIGNYTISLRQCGDLDRALESAQKRIKLRRDVHSIEEMVSVLTSERKLKRTQNLPEAILIAKQQGDLINEGLEISSVYFPLRIAQIQLYRFAYNSTGAVKLCKALLKEDACNPAYREAAFAEMVEEFSDMGLLQETLDVIKSNSQNIKNQIISDRIKALEMSVYANHFMIGKHGKDGLRVIIPGVTEYYLKTEDGHYREPVMAAQVLEWIGQIDKAVVTLSSFLSDNPKHWEGNKAIALIYLRNDRKGDAFAHAERLLQIAPWLTESYDCLAYVAERVGKLQLAQEVKQKGEQILDQEKALFEELRVTIKKL